MARKQVALTEEIANRKEAEADANSRSIQRITYHLPSDLVDKIRDVAWWDRATINEVVRTAIVNHIETLEQQRGEPYPKRTGGLRSGKPLV